MTTDEGPPKLTPRFAKCQREYEDLKAAGKIRLDEIKKIDSGEKTHSWAARNAMRRIARANGNARVRTDRITPAAVRARTNFIRAIGIMHSAADALSTMTDPLPALSEKERKMVRKRLGEVLKVILHIETKEGIQ